MTSARTRKHSSQKVVPRPHLPNLPTKVLPETESEDVPCRNDWWKLFCPPDIISQPLEYSGLLGPGIGGVSPCYRQWYV